MANLQHMCLCECDHPPQIKTIWLSSKDYNIWVVNKKQITQVFCVKIVNMIEDNKTSPVSKNNNEHKIDAKIEHEFEKLTSDAFDNDLKGRMDDLTYKPPTKVKILDEGGKEVLVQVIKYRMGAFLGQVDNGDGTYRTVIFSKDKIIPFPN